MEATTLIPIGMGLIVIGAAIGISRFAAAEAASSARPVAYTHLQLPTKRLV